MAILHGKALSRKLASYVLGNPGIIKSGIASFFPDGSFPIREDADLLNDVWIASGFSAPPSSPYTQIYSEGCYARSVAIRRCFWNGDEIPFLILHGKRDTQVLWDDAQEIYNNIISCGGGASLYTLKLYEDSPEVTAATAFIGTDAAKLLTHRPLAGYYTDGNIYQSHGSRVKPGMTTLNMFTCRSDNYGYGRGETLPRLTKKVNPLPEPTTMLLLGLGLNGLTGMRGKFLN